jgi:peptidoglycan/xylan/chitin deacetylase (PgdA/CDA1 family)
MKPISVFWHTVHANSTSPDRRGGNPTAALFKQQIQFLVKNYTPISVAEFLRIHNDKGLRRCYTKPPLLLGFDDGLKNVIKNAVPVLKEFNIPAVLFVIGETLKNQNFVPWYVELRHLIRKATKKTVVYNNTRIDVNLPRDAAKLRYLFAVTFRSCKVESDRQRLLANLADMLGLNRPKAYELDEDLRFVEKKDLMDMTSAVLTVASHAMTHRDLGTLTHDEQLHELEDSDLLLRAQCPSYYPVIAYPSGSFNRETITIAASIYKAGFATLSGSYRNLYAYPRIALEDDSIGEVAYAVSSTRLNYILPLKQLFRVTRVVPDVTLFR